MRDRKEFTGLEIVGVLNQIQCSSRALLASHGGDSGSIPLGWNANLLD
jgi:hypothetical protein